METRVLTAHVPVDLAIKVDEVASRIERSRGWIIKQALAAWVDQEEMRHTLTLEALEDVDAGRVASHARVHDWAASLGTANPLPLPGARRKR
jgi:predicted transcriptional regulator